ncbi:MAG: hypothetical protein WCF90_08815 [Methanomicrobiales archaeon]
MRDLLAGEIGMQVCCLLEDIERGKDLRGRAKIQPILMSSAIVLEN